MAGEDKKTVDPQIDDLMAQVAAESARADNAEAELKDISSKLTSAEGERDSLRENLKQAKDQIRKDAASRQPEDALRDQNRALLRKCERLEQERNDALAPERLAKAVKERVALERAAQTVFGDQKRFDEMSDRTVMVEVIEKLHGTTIDKEKSDDYVRARFDAAIEGYSAGAAALARVREAAADRRQDEEARKDHRSAREKFLEQQENAWKGADA
jgi:hypothetical protein